MFRLKDLLTPETTETPEHTFAIQYRERPHPSVALEQVLETISNVHNAEYDTDAEWRRRVDPWSTFYSTPNRDGALLLKGLLEECFTLYDFRMIQKINAGSHGRRVNPEDL